MKKHICPVCSLSFSSNKHCVSHIHEKHGWELDYTGERLLEVRL